eukprot:scaffold6513_cov125-Isochrysis_galbana.AAC.3
MCILCLREGGADGGAVSARGAAPQRRCRPRLADRPIDLVASDGMVMADTSLCMYCDRLKAVAGAAGEATAAAAELSSAAHAPDEPAGMSRAIRVRLPLLRVATLRQVLDFCRRHRNVGGDTDAVGLMWRRFAESLSAEDRARLGPAARYLGCAALCVLVGDGADGWGRDGAAAGAGSDRLRAAAVMGNVPTAGREQLGPGETPPTVRGAEPLLSWQPLVALSTSKRRRRALEAGVGNGPGGNGGGVCGWEKAAAAMGEARVKPGLL